jgi:hypothetical protein
VPFGLVPIDAAQTSHAPEHAELQQKPSAQCPFAQSASPFGHG